MTAMFNKSNDNNELELAKKKLVRDEDPGALTDVIAKLTPKSILRNVQPDYTTFGARANRTSGTFKHFHCITLDILTNGGP